MILIISLLLASIASAAPVASYRWTVDVSSPPRPVAVSAMRGESLTLECRLVDRGTPLRLPDGTSAELFWQTNAMSNVWWRVPATVSDGVVRGVWAPPMDGGASSVSFFLGAKVPSGELLYRAFGRLSLVGSPGSLPNSLELPRRVIDFGQTEAVGTLALRDGWVDVMAGDGLGTSYMYDSLWRCSEDYPDGVWFYLRAAIDSPPDEAGRYNVAVVEEIPAIVARELRVCQNTIWDEESGVTWLRVMRGGNVYYRAVTNVNLLVKEEL